MLLNKRFDYPRLAQNTRPDGYRTYGTPTGEHPSVTTILAATGDSSVLDEWRARVGEKEAERESREAVALGSLLHRHMECFIGGEPRPTGNNLIRRMSSRMADIVIECGMGRVQEVWGCEEGLYFPDLYAGTSDVIGLHDGEEAICDFKTSKKIKPEEWIHGYFMQGCAYAMAHNHLFGTDIRKVVIFMVSRDYKFQEFIVQRDRFEYFTGEWIKRVERFYNC